MKLKSKINLLFIIFAGIFILASCGQKEYSITLKTLEEDQILVYEKKTVLEKFEGKSFSEYGFVDWYYDENFTSLVTFPLTIKQDYTFYASYSTEKFAISFDSNGGTSIASEEHFKNTTLNAPEDPRREGFRFSGWFYDRDLTNSFSFFITKMPDYDLTLYAKWIELNSILFDAGEGTKVENIYALPGEEIERPTDPERENWIFEGWFEKNSELPFIFPEIMPDKKVELSSKWRPQNLDVTLQFSSNDRILNDLTLQNLKELDSFNLPILESNEENIFYGWFYDQNFLEPANNIVPKESVTLYAKFIRNSNYAKVTIQNTVLFIKKQTYLPDALIPEIEVPKGCIYNGFLKENGTIFNPETESVLFDMNLKPNIYTDGIEFEPVYQKSYDDNDFLIEIIVSYNVKSFQPTDSGTELIIPTYYLGKPVTMIYPEVFKNQKNFTKLILSDELVFIGKEAFSGCENIQKVKFPKKLVELGDYAFKDCKNLSQVEISALKFVGTKVFENTKYIENMRNLQDNRGLLFLDEAKTMLYEYIGNMPSNYILSIRSEKIVLICGGAFMNQVNLYKASIKINSLYLCNSLFEGCTNLTIVELDDGVGLIGERVFKDCIKLKALQLPVNLQVLNKEALYNCSSIQNLELPVKLVKIGDRAFAQMKNLEYVLQDVKAIFTEIPAYAFEGCSSLKEFVVLDKVLVVREGAFKDCTSLQRVSLGYNKAETALEKIEKFAFQNCTALAGVYANKYLSATDKVIEVEENSFPSNVNYHFYVTNESPVKNESSKYFDRNQNRMMTYYEIYQSILGSEANKVFYKDTKSPEVKVHKNSFYIEPTMEFDIFNLINDDEVYTATDDITESSKLTLMIVSVKLNDTFIDPIREGVYQLSEIGQYVVYVRVIDEYGNYRSFTIKIYTHVYEE